ncbi:hypothetical protein [Zooshikella harenae]|uniref:Uncharacterized protein n=1 Tax=Zooshikella harenae TaxID=2827238 RepID=A0ABS5ZHC7_9GAMM|nr:hypothetical protein [Zooshikella harenae]MBU2713278.1 hypothetical protein [Zooshikella harenae]
MLLQLKKHCLLNVAVLEHWSQINNGSELTKTVFINTSVNCIELNMICDVQVLLNIVTDDMLRNLLGVIGGNIKHATSF